MDAKGVNLFASIRVIRGQEFDRIFFAGFCVFCGR
jgi:hypothetical protein